MVSKVRRKDHVIAQSDKKVIASTQSPSARDCKRPFHELCRFIFISKLFFPFQYPVLRKTSDIPNRFKALESARKKIDVLYNGGER